MRKSIYIALTLLLSHLFISCDKKYSDSELKANFSVQQISDLNKTKDFFKNQVCKTDFKTCFNITNHDSLLANGVGIWTKIDLNEQEQLYKNISKSTFAEIWMFCESTFYPSKIKAKSLCASTSGKYLKYLYDLGKTNPRIAKYAKKIELSGNFNSLDLQYHEIINENDAFDLNDPNIQLILAIHYLSINDQVKRNKDLIELPKNPKFE